jgi:hypothetical protein
MRHVLDEIDARLDAAHTRATGRGAALRPPVLVLGVSERMGSNWLSDLLRAALVQHNEPLRQQSGAAHPLSALNPGVADITSAELDGTVERLAERKLDLSWAGGSTRPVRQTGKPRRGGGQRMPTVTLEPGFSTVGGPKAHEIFDVDVQPGGTAVASLHM